MSNNLDPAFIVQWNSEVRQKLNESPSNLRSLVENVTVNATEYKWHIMGTGAATVNRPRFTNLEPMNLQHSTVSTFLTKVEAAEFTDEIDELQTNISVRQPYTDEIVRVIENKKDRLVLDALATATQTFTVGTFDAAKLILMSTTMGNAGVPAGERHVIIDYKGLEDILNDNKLQNRDYVMANGYGTGMIQNYFGLNILVVQSEKLTETAGGRQGYAFWKKGVGFASLRETTTGIDWRPEGLFWMLWGQTAAGASVIQPESVWKFDITQS